MRRQNGQLSAKQLHVTPLHCPCNITWWAYSNRQRFVCVLLATFRTVIGRRIAGSSQNPFGCQQSLNSDRSTGVNPTGANSHFGSWTKTNQWIMWRYYLTNLLLTQSETISVGKARTGVVEHASAVHWLEEPVGFLSCVKCGFRLELQKKKRDESNLPFSVTMVSVWELPKRWIWSTASRNPLTTSTVHSKLPYSVFSDLAGGGPNVKCLLNEGPA